MRFRPEKTYPRPQWPPPYSVHSRRSRGADEASGGRTGSRGRPAPAWMLTTGRYGDGGLRVSCRRKAYGMSGMASASGNRPFAVPNPRMMGGRSMRAQEKPARVKRLSPLQTNQTGGASRRGESRFAS